MIVNPAGGLRYHFRAALYTQSLWQPFRKAIGEWLRSWNPPEKKLILIGASGGYSLNSDFLGRFDKIIAVDPDPLAGLIFRNRFALSKSRVQWIKADFFITAGHSAESLHAFLSQHPDAAILFSNFLGQLPFLTAGLNKEEELIHFWQDALPGLLQGRARASFHDRYSSKKAPRSQRNFSADHQLEGEELIAQFYGNDLRGEWRDHSTQGFFSAQSSYDYFLWPLTPKSFHIIEGVYCPAGH